MWNLLRRIRFSYSVVKGFITYIIYVSLLMMFYPSSLQRMKKSRDPRWDDEFTFMLDEPPTNEKMHVEVESTSSRIGLLHPKVWIGIISLIYYN